MEIITLWQPWASFIAEGWKTIETRTHDRFKNLEGRTIGIHAGMKWDRDWYELASPYMTEEQKKLALERQQRYMCNRGKILCVAEVEECCWLFGLEDDNKQALIDCGLGDRYGLHLKNIRLIEPYPAKGKQGIWHINPSFFKYL
jgi:hypothetical protein